METPRRFGNLVSEKNALNIRERGIDFADATEFGFDTAMIFDDDRRDYGERRTVGIGFIRGRVHVLVFTMRSETCHVISLRKANKREIRRYVQES